MKEKKDSAFAKWFVGQYGKLPAGYGEREALRGKISSLKWEIRDAEAELNVEQCLYDQWNAALTAWSSCMSTKRAKR